MVTTGPDGGGWIGSRAITREAGGVVLGVLDPLLQGLEAIDLAGKLRRDGGFGDVAALGDLRRRTRRIGMGDFPQAQCPRHLPALGQRLNVAAHDLDGVERRSRRRQQLMVHPLDSAQR